MMGATGAAAAPEEPEVPEEPHVPEPFGEGEDKGGRHFSLRDTRK
jgi:hypothetical protein